MMNPIDMIVELRERCKAETDVGKMLECIEELRRIVNEMYIPVLVDNIREYVDRVVEDLRKKVGRCRSEKCVKRKVEMVDAELADVQILLDEILWYIEL